MDEIHNDLDAMPKPRRNKRSAHLEKLPFPCRRGGPISKHLRVSEKIKMVVMDLEETEAWNNCAALERNSRNCKPPVLWSEMETTHKKT
jgi:hypothetical protein